VSLTGRPTELRIRVGGEVEVSLDGVVVLSTAADVGAGELQLLVDGGEAELRDGRWAPVDDPVAQSS